ncbi:MAG TPA: T9SS type A sorting domain-containing protein, partial [Chitinophagaceae bacterium]|nr:T9SS type A sorting domain-containing protein [Chitinophagaceae bacterium]
MLYQSPSSDRVYYVAKCNSSGNLMWIKDFNWGSTGLLYTFNDLAIDRQGQIIICGNAHEPINYPYPNYDLVEAKVWKLDTSGNLIWNTVFPTIPKFNSGSSEILNVAIDTAQNIVLLGQFTDSLDSDPSSNTQWLTSGSITNTDLFLIKLDSMGHRIWSESIHGPFNEFTFGLQINNSNQLFISGVAGAYTDFDTDTSIHYLDTSATTPVSFLASYSADGQYRWVANLNANQLCATYENSILVSGKLQASPNINPFGNPVIPTISFSPDTYLASYDSMGNLLWYKIFRSSSFNDELSFRDISISSDKSIFIAGDYTFNIDFDPDLAVIHADSTSSAFLLKLDSLGRFISVKGFNQANSHCPRIEIQDQTLNSNDEIVLCGRLNNIFLSSDSSDMNPDANQTSLYFPSGTADGFLLNLTNCTQHIFDTLHVCDSLVLGNNVYYTSQFYNSVYPSGMNCDTTLNTFYSVLHLDTSVVQLGSQLKANDSNAHYQWIQCNPFLLLTNDTNQIFTPTSNGDYAVILSNESCLDTSACVYFQTNGLQTSSQTSNVSIYPNPVSNYLKISVAQDEKIKSKRVWNSLGQLVYTDTSPNTDIQVSTFQSGLYYLDLYTNKGRYRQHFMVLKNTP